MKIIVKRAGTFMLIFMTLTLASFFVPVNAYDHDDIGWNHYRITLCDATDYDELGYAVDGWNDCEIDPYFQIVPGTNADAGIVDVYKPDEEWVGKTTHIRFLWFWFISCTIKMNTHFCDTCSSNQLKFAIGHELGHCLGLLHYEPGFPLMFPTVRESPTLPTQDDIDGIDDLYG